MIVTYWLVHALLTVRRQPAVQDSVSGIALRLEVTECCGYLTSHRSASVMNGKTKLSALVLQVISPRTSRRTYTLSQACECPTHFATPPAVPLTSGPIRNAGGALCCHQSEQVRGVTVCGVPCMCGGADDCSCNIGYWESGRKRPAAGLDSCGPLPSAGVQPTARAEINYDRF